MTNRDAKTFGGRYGIDAREGEKIKKLSHLMHQYALQQTHVCNGDPHVRVSDRTDKNANAQEWDRDSEATAAEIEKTARGLGFDGVDYSGGLYPTLKKGGETGILVP